MTRATAANAVATDRAEALRDYIGTARWFGGKGRSFTVDGVSELGWLSDPAGGQWPAVRTEIVELSYPSVAGQPDDHDPDLAPDDVTDDPAREFYQLVLAYRPDPDRNGNGDWPDGLTPVCRIDDPEHGTLIGVDAAQDPEARRVLLIRLLGQYAATADHGSLSFRLLDADLAAADGLVTSLPSTMFGGQQSNTSIMYGDVAMLKLFRRLELGRNLDIEAHQVLNEAGLTDVAKLYGWLEGTWQTTAGVRHTADFGMVVEKLREAQDGWELCLDTLRGGGDFLADAEALGRALGEIHQALRTHFATSTIDGDELAEVMEARLSVAVQAAPQLADHAAGLRACFDELRGRELPTQRVHGDFHLGQTLHTPSGWKIIDFEGEPAKTMAERVAPDNPWRDVAGLIRSFSYAAASVADTDPDWAGRAQDAMLTGYLGAGTSAGASARASAGNGAEDGAEDGAGNGADTAHPVGTDRLLRAYLADKAVYEVVYEVRNRPDWVGIPLGAVAELAHTDVR